MKRLLRDQRGAASLEAAVMLPLMAACWLGVLFRMQTLDATLVAGVEARRAAWVSSNEGCRDEALCEGSGSGDDDFSSGGWLDGLTDAPIVGALFGSILGYATTARSSRELDRPVLFGGGKVKVGYGYYVMCNERPMDVTDLLKTSICEQLPALDFIVGRCPPPRYANVDASCE